jgi:hypothetical protein
MIRHKKIKKQGDEMVRVYEILQYCNNSNNMKIVLAGKAADRPPVCNLSY